MENVIKEGLRDAIKIDGQLVQSHLNEIVLETVEQTLNGLLGAEADRLCGAERYQRTENRLDTRAGTYERKLHTKQGKLI
jgi:transposase-like protein